MVAKPSLFALFLPMKIDEFRMMLIHQRYSLVTFFTTQPMCIYTHTYPPKDIADKTFHYYT